MTEKDFDMFLATLRRTLHTNRRQREAIVGELRDHLLERLDDLVAQGASREEAITRALEEFGDAAVLAAHFTAINRQRNRRLIMRTTIGTVAAAVAVVVGIFAFWPQGTDVPLAPRTVTAQEEAKPVEKSARLLGEDALDDATLEKLEKHIDVDFVETPLADVLEFLESTAEVQFYVDHKALATLGVDTDAPVSLSLKSISGEMALDLMLKQLELAYVLRNGIIIVTTSNEAEYQMTTRVYLVKDLKADSLGRADAGATSQARLALDAMSQLAQRSERFGGGGFGGFVGGGGGLGGGGVTEDDTIRVPLLESMVKLLEQRDSLEADNPDAAKNKEREFYQLARAVLRQSEPPSPYDELADLIKTSVKPDSWDDVGGPGSIGTFRDTLVVSNSRDVHRKIEALLQQLRELDAQNATPAAATTAEDAATSEATNE